MNDLSPLWEPISVGDALLKNRISIPAHQTHYAVVTNNLVGQQYIDYMEARARGGAGLLVVEAGAVHESTGKLGLLDLHRPEILPGLSRLVETVQGHDAKIFAQLSHLGSQDLGTSLVDRWHPVVGPSALPSTVYGRVAMPLDQAGIDDVVKGYGVAARNAVEAGIDGLELSAGHGYLLCQFLSPLTNLRQDDYGGSVENRCRLVLEIGAEIRSICGSGVPLGVRVSFDEFLGDAGITPDYAEEMLRVLHGSSLFDYFSITAGNYHTIHQWLPSISSRHDGHLASYGGRARRVVAEKIPIMVSAAIRTLDRAAGIVADGDADLIGMVRAHIADPDLVEKARSGRVEEIRHCVGANQGCMRRIFSNLGVTCTVNPAAGRERIISGQAEPASDPMRILVVGGGPAGLELAQRAAGAGHDVCLVEREAQLGGQLRLAGLLPDRETWLELADSLVAGVIRAGVDVRLQTEATPEWIRTQDADRVFVATGAVYDRSGASIAVPGRRALPGASLEHVLDPAAAIADPEVCGATVAILDDLGDYTSLALALMVADTGRRVELLVRHSQAGLRLEQTGDLPWIRPRLTEAGVRITTEVLPIEIRSDQVDYRAGGSAETSAVRADTVILNIMKRSDDLHSRLGREGLQATALGDCLAPREVDDALYEAAMQGTTLRTGLA